MKYAITVTPNRERGYDATVSFTFRGETEAMKTCNAPTEAKARADAEAWLANEKKELAALRKASPKRARFNEGDAEGQEAARNERDYQ